MSVKEVFSPYIQRPNNNNEVYNPNFETITPSDKRSDNWHNTDIVEEKNRHNNMELQKWVNINKYSWNMEGMKSVGINPLMGSANLSSVSQSQAQSNSTSEPGVFDKMLIDMFKSISPSKIIEDIKDIIKEVL